MLSTWGAFRWLLSAAKISIYIYIKIHTTTVRHEINKINLKLHNAVVCWRVRTSLAKAIAAGPEESHDVGYDFTLADQIRVPANLLTLITTFGKAEAS